MEGQAGTGIRNSVTSTRQAERLLDGSTGTWWLSLGIGDSASFLLDRPLRVESGVALVKDESASAGYRLLTSENYRDWDLRLEGTARGFAEASEPISFNPGTARYLRFISLDDNPASWNLQTGRSAEVQDWLRAQKPADWGDITDPQVIAGMLDLAFDWQHANPTDIHNGIGWITGAFYSGVSALYETTGQSKYRQAILDLGNQSDWTLHNFNWGKRFYHADNQCIGQTWLELYLWEAAAKPVWIADLKARLDRIMANSLPGREDYSWCDALYMGPPNYVRLATITGDETYRSFIDAQWWDAVEFLYDAEHHLFYRDANFFDQREPNGSPVFWGRGNGWVMGGLVRMLQYMPEDWPTRARYVTLLKEMATAVAAIQGEDGLWSASLLYPEKFDFERETSGSAFLAYAIAWAVNNGILDKATYGPVIERAWEGLSTMLTPAGTLNFIQQQGAAPAAANGELRDKDYGYGAFLLAGTEMMAYYSRTSRSATLRQLAQDAGNPVATVNPTLWTRIDDFEGLFDWAIRKTLDASERLRPDPVDTSGSQVFSINTGNRQTGVYRATKDIPAIANGVMATVYQRFCYNDPEIDVVFGVADQPVVDAYGDYETGIRIYHEFNQLEARAGSEYAIIGKDLLELGSWYETWTVIDGASKTYDVYLRGGSNYPRQVLLREKIPFRKGSGNTLSAYAISYNGALSEGTFFLDDLYLDRGRVNLSRPQSVRQPGYSPWADIGRDPVSLAKDTPAGPVWDGDFPWVYLGELESWCFVPADAPFSGGNLLWLLASESWIWLPDGIPGWYFDFGLGAWVSF